MRLVLASASPRRRELLEAAGIAFDVDAADVDESLHPGETPEAHVDRLARLKAETVAVRHPGRIVLGADTVVVIDHAVLGKPVDAADAAAMLRRLSGRAHEVLTGVALSWRGVTHARVDRTIVHVAELSGADIERYVASGEPMDKAGASAIQGLASRFIIRIDGSYGTVVGLPVASVLQLLTRSAAILPTGQFSHRTEVNSAFHRGEFPTAELRPARPGRILMSERRDPMPNRVLRVVVSAGVIIGAVTLLFLATVRDGAQFYKKVDEVMSSPEQWYGKPLQLHGFVEGEPDHTGNGLDYKFKIQNGGAVVNASYHGTDMPDTFKEGSEVVLTGRLTAAGFRADHVMAKCPSKYTPSAAGGAAGPAVSKAGK